jgi:hypothetical protein
MISRKASTTMARLALAFVSIGMAFSPLGAQAPRKPGDQKTISTNPPISSPSSTAQRFLSALADARIDDARSLLADLNTGSNAPTTRDLLGLVGSFRYLLERGYEILPLTTQGDLALVEIRSRSPDGSARMDSLPLVRERGEWRVALREKPADFANIMRLTTPERDSLALMMKADLRDFATAQEAFLADSGRYASGVTRNRGRDRRPLAGFFPSAGVEIEFKADGKTGWRAVARHMGTTRQCAMFVGLPGPIEAATVEGDPACSK